MAVPSDYFVSTQLQLWLLCCWGCGCCWAVTIVYVGSELRFIICVLYILDFLIMLEDSFSPADNILLHFLINPFGKFAKLVIWYPKPLQNIQRRPSCFIGFLSKLDMNKLNKFLWSEFNRKNRKLYYLLIVLNKFLFLYNFVFECLAKAKLLI